MLGLRSDLMGITLEFTCSLMSLDQAMLWTDSIFYTVRELVHRVRVMESAVVVDSVESQASLEELVKLDRKEGVTGITLEEKRERDRVISEVKQLALLEEILLRQKSRVLWLKEGDNNSIFIIGWLIHMEEIIMWVI